MGKGEHGSQRSPRLIRRALSAALELAIKKDDEDAGHRLTAAAKAIFDD